MPVVNNSLGRVAGEIAKITDGQQIEAFFNSEASASLPFGYVAVKDSAKSGAGKLPSAAGDKVLGIVVREVRQGDVNGDADVDVGKVGSVMRMGYITVFCAAGTPVDGAPVYYRYIADGVKLPGMIETAAVQDKVIELEGATFNGTVDEDGLVEIRVNLQ